jgi:hypothetical protein
MMRIKLQALWVYYRGICPFTLLASFGFLYTYQQFQDGKSLFIFSKVITLILTAILLKFFYRIVVLGFDLTLFVLLLKLIDLL